MQQEEAEEEWMMSCELTIEGFEREEVCDKERQNAYEGVAVWAVC